MDSARFASSLSTLADTGAAVQESVTALRRALDGRRADLLVLFVSHHHGAELEGLARTLQAELGPRVLLGCTGETIVEGSSEVENGPGFALWAVACEAMELRPFRIRARRTPEGGIEFDGFPRVEEPRLATLLLMGDPFSFPMAEYLRTLEERFPDLPAVGGMASGGMGPGQNFLYMGEELLENGAVGCVIEGGIELHPVVSQGCRPVGKPWVVTAAKDNLVTGLGGRSAAKVLVETLRGLPPSEAELFQSGPFLGVALDASKSEFERGDFLVRGIMGVQAETGAVAVADHTLRPGRTVQFLVRDATSAGEDLRQLLLDRAGGPRSEGTGALLFSCNGRGTRMFDAPHHDATHVQSCFEQPVPLAGIFAMGEIGPVGGRNFLHGFTASVAVFRSTGSEG